jgi:endo-1,4-beta-mannosidase
VTGAQNRVVAPEDVYDYKPAWLEGKSLEWHVNFADPHLFTAYGTSLFTQDEMQVAEHPILGSLREAILSRGLPALTVEDGSPTPVLVAGAERRCRRGGPQRFLGVRSAPPGRKKPLPYE